MNGYYISCGFMGLVDGTYRLFVNESEYLEWIREDQA